MYVVRNPGTLIFTRSIDLIKIIVKCEGKIFSRNLILLKILLIIYVKNIFNILREFRFNLFSFLNRFMN